MHAHIHKVLCRPQRVAHLQDLSQAQQVVCAGVHELACRTLLNRDCHASTIHIHAHELLQLAAPVGCIRAAVRLRDHQHCYIPAHSNTGKNGSQVWLWMFVLVAACQPPHPPHQPHQTQAGTYLSLRKLSSMSGSITRSSCIRPAKHHHPTNITHNPTTTPAEERN
jgi:hypothetical protein